MEKSEIMSKLEKNAKQKKQLDDLSKLINDAVKKEMPVYKKLVQFDVMAEVQKLAGADGLTDAEGKMSKVTKELDAMMKQFDNDVRESMKKHFENMKK